MLSVLFVQVRFGKKKQDFAHSKVLYISYICSVKFKAHGQEFTECEFSVCQYDREIIIAEFAHNLQASTAGTAWVAEIALRTTDDGYCFEFFAALGHCLESLFFQRRLSVKTSCFQRCSL